MSTVTAEVRSLYSAITSGDVELARKLITEKKELTTYSSSHTISWLHHAAASGSFEMIRLFLSAGLDINKVDKPAETSPLIKALGNGHVDVVEFLLSKGADPNLGRPIIAATNLEDPGAALAIVKLLVEHGADVNRHFPWFGSKDMGFTPLEWAESNGKTEIAEYLRSKGAVSPAKPKRAPANLEEEIVAHLEKQFAPAKPGALREIVSSGAPIAIHVILPTKKHQQLTLFTTGMSDQAMKVPTGQDDYRYAELVIHLPADWPVTKKSLSDPKYNWPFRWLQETARYPHENNTWLGGPFTLISKDPQVPLAKNTKLTAMLLAAKEEMHCRDGRLIQFYTLVPMYPEERDLELRKGLAALMRALDKHGVSDVVDLKRKNAATGE